MSLELQNASIRLIHQVFELIHFNRHLATLISADDFNQMTLYLERYIGHHATNLAMIFGWLS